LQQTRSSEAEQVSVSFTNKFPLTKLFSEKYLKKLIGKNDIEDALKRLDRLTQEEARMAAAQLLKVTNTIDNRVEGIADNVLVVDNRVAGIDDRVAGVDERMAGVDERVAGVDEHVAGVDDRVKDVDDKVRAVDDKLVAVIDGTQYIFNQLSKVVQPLMHLDGKEARGVIQQTADGVDRMERSWFPNRIHAGHAGSFIITGNQLRQDLRRWLSPPDPSTNHNIASNAHHKGTATWFFEGRTYKEWKSPGSESLLWVHGKRVSLSILPPGVTY
jgi:archaellum component FlaC